MATYSFAAQRNPVAIVESVLRARRAQSGSRIPTAGLEMAALWVSIVTLLVLSWLVDEAAADAAAKETTRHTEGECTGMD